MYHTTSVRQTKAHSVHISGTLIGAVAAAVGIASGSGVQALVLTPTREIAIQVCDELSRMLWHVTESVKALTITPQCSPPYQPQERKGKQLLINKKESWPPQQPQYANE